MNERQLLIKVYEANLASARSANSETVLRQLMDTQRPSGYRQSAAILPETQNRLLVPVSVTAFIRFPANSQSVGDGWSQMCMSGCGEHWLNKCYSIRRSARGSQEANTLEGRHFV